jgi:hypothetical protein
MAAVAERRRTRKREPHRDARVSTHRIFSSDGRETVWESQSGGSRPARDSCAIAMLAVVTRGCRMVPGRGIEMVTAGAEHAGWDAGECATSSNETRPRTKSLPRNSAVAWTPTRDDAVVALASSAIREARKASSARTIRTRMASALLPLRAQSYVVGISSRRSSLRRHRRTAKKAHCWQKFVANALMNAMYQGQSLLASKRLLAHFV